MWEQLTFWSEEPPARTSPSQAKEQASETSKSATKTTRKKQDQASRLTLCDWLMKRAVNTSSGKTFPAYSVPTGAEISLPFYPGSADTESTLQVVGGSQADSSRTADLTATASRGECWTRNLPEFPAFRSPYPNADGVCSLSDVLETGNVPPQYYLSPTACRGILHRASKRGKSLPEVLEIALRRQSECAPDAMGGGKGALVGDNLSHTLQTGNDQTVVEFAQDCANTVEASCYKGPAETWNELTIVSQFWNGEDVAEAMTTTSNNQRMPDKSRLQCVIEPAVECIDTRQVEVQETELAPTLMASMYEKNSLEDCDKYIVEGKPVGFIKNDAGGEQQGFWGDTFPMLRSGALPAVAYNVSFCDANGTRKDRPDGGLYVTEADASKTVTAGGTNAETVVIDSVAIAENIIGRQDHTGGNGVGAQEELAYTQNATGVMGVATMECVPLDLRNATRDPEKKDEQNRQGVGVGEDGSPMNTITSASVPGVGWQSTVRKLLPVECERLMGFPDNHTRIKWKGKSEEECPDAPRYKACGNSFCCNVVEWIGRRIDMFDEPRRNK